MQLELELEIERCHVKIHDLRCELLKSSENNIFALLNLPIPSNLDPIEWSKIKKNYDSTFQ